MWNVKLTFNEEDSMKRSEKKELEQSVTKKLKLPQKVEKMLEKAVKRASEPNSTKPILLIVTNTEEPGNGDRPEAL